MIFTANKVRLLGHLRVPMTVIPPTIIVADGYRLGMNMSGPESGNAYPTFDMLQHYAAHGMPYIRQPMSWNAMQPTMGAALDEGEFGKFSAVLAMCAKLGISVLADPWHQDSTRLINGVGYKPGTTQVPTSAVADYLGRFVARSRQDPNYAVIRGWDTTNEPNHLDPAHYNDPGFGSNSVSQAIVADMMQRIITAIRATGDALPIYVEGDHYSGAWDWVVNNAALLLGLNDPLKNLVASIHCYLDNDSSGSNFNWTAETQKAGVSPPGVNVTTQIGPQRMATLVAWAKQNGVRLHLGEVGWGMNEAGWNQAGDAMLAYCQANGIEVTYWSSGFNFGPNFAYQYDPDPFLPNSNTRDFSARGTPSPQSAVLQKYAGQPKTYVLSLPVDANNRFVRFGAAGQASTPFKILFGGKLTKDVTITPSDGGKGGTFTPATVKLTVGQHINDAVSFTYTPSKSAQFRISTTNDGGLIDPPALSFSSVLDPFVQSGILVDPLNVFWPNRIFASYAGHAARIAKTSDLTTADAGTTFPASIPVKDIDFLPSGAMDTATADSYGGGAALSVVTLYDQGLAGSALGPIVTSGQSGTDSYGRPKGDNAAGPASSVDSSQYGTYMGITPAKDCPAFAEGAYNGLPALRFNASRMDAFAQIDGLAGFTMLFAVNPQTVADAAFMFDWVVADHFQVCDPNGNLDILDAAAANPSQPASSRDRCTPTPSGSTAQGSSSTCSETERRSTRCRRRAA